MYFHRPTSRFVLIGTVQGNGFDCVDGTVTEFEGSPNGVWNKVSAHMEWIRKTMEDLGETGCGIKNRMSPGHSTNIAHEDEENPEVEEGPTPYND